MALEWATTLRVLPLDSESSDHSALALTMHTATLNSPQRQVNHCSKGPRQRKRHNPSLPNDTELDHLVIEAINSKASPETRLWKLYGSATEHLWEVQVCVDGLCLNNGKKDPRAGAEIFYRPGNARNTAVCVPGRQTNNRGEILAILTALIQANPHKKISIYSDSEYAIKMLTEWAPDKHSIGWNVENGDLLSDTV